MLIVGWFTWTTRWSQRCRSTYLKQCIKSLVNRQVHPSTKRPDSRSSITSSLISRSLGYTDVSPENPHPQQDSATSWLGLMPEETLYSVFKQSTTGLRTARQEADKLKAINSTGRVDFVIQVLHLICKLTWQEGLFETSYLSAIAAHLQYWDDDDVAHFMLSQLLLGTQHKAHEKHDNRPSQ